MQKQLGECMMCNDMRRFEKMAEEKKRCRKEQELKFAVEDQSEIHISSSFKSGRPKKR
jgi:hypothetical protein